MINTRFSTITFVCCLILSMILVVHLLFGFINPIVMAMVIVSLFSPIYLRLLRLCRQRDYLAALFATFLMLVVIMIPLALFMFVLGQQALTLFQATQQLTSSTNISSFVSSLKTKLDLLNLYLYEYHLSISPDRVLKLTTAASQAVGKWIYNSIGLIAGNVFLLVFNFVLTIALVFVFFVSGPTIKQFLMQLIPFPEHEKEKVIRRFKQLASAVFVGNGLISALEGILGGISFFVVGIPGGLIFGVVMAITAFLPVVGATIVIIPAAIYLYLVGKTWAATAFLIFNVLQLSILEALIKPRFIGTKSQMHAVLVFMSVLAGIQIYGVFGLFYGPLVVTIFLTLAEIYREDYREKLLRGPLK